MNGRKSWDSKARPAIDSSGWAPPHTSRSQPRRVSIASWIASSNYTATTGGFLLKLPGVAESRLASTPSRRPGRPGRREADEACGQPYPKGRARTLAAHDQAGFSRQRLATLGHGVLLYPMATFRNVDFSAISPPTCSGRAVCNSNASRIRRGEVDRITLRGVSMTFRKGGAVDASQTLNLESAGDRIWLSLVSTGAAVYQANASRVDHPRDITAGDREACGTVRWGDQQGYPRGLCSRLEAWPGTGAGVRDGWRGAPAVPRSSRPSELAAIDSTPGEEVAQAAITFRRPAP